MDVKENFKLSGRLKITVDHADGCCEVFVVKNLVVGSGTHFVAQRMVDASLSVMTHMALGSATNTAANDDTELGHELGRVKLTRSTVNGNKVIYSAIFPAGTATGPISEAALFNADSSGVMLCRSVFGVKTKDAGDTFTISWEVTLKAT